MTTKHDTTDAEGECELQDLAAADFSPIFSQQDVEAQEASYNTTWGVSRRIMLLTLCASRDTLVERLGDLEGVETALEMVEQINTYRDHLKSGIELAESASTRLLAVAAAIHSQYVD